MVYKRRAAAAAGRIRAAPATIMAGVEQLGVPLLDLAAAPSTRCSGFSLSSRCREELVLDRLLLCRRRFPLVPMAASPASRRTRPCWVRTGVGLAEQRVAARVRALRVDARGPRSAHVRRTAGGARVDAKPPTRLLRSPPPPPSTPTPRSTTQPTIAATTRRRHSQSGRRRRTRRSADGRLERLALQHRRPPPCPACSTRACRASLPHGASIGKEALKKPGALDLLLSLARRAFALVAPSAEVRSTVSSKVRRRVRVCRKSAAIASGGSGEEARALRGGRV